MSTEKAIAPLLPSTQSDIDQAQRSARLKYLTLFVLLFALASNTATSGEGWIGSFALTSVEGPVRQPALFAWALLGLFDAWSIVDIRVCDPLAAKTLTGNDLDEIGGIAAQHPEVQALMSAIAGQRRTIQRYDLWVAKDWVEGRYARHLRSDFVDTINAILRVTALIGVTTFAFNEPWFAGWFRWLMVAITVVVTLSSFAHVVRRWLGLTTGSVTARRAIREPK